MRRRQKNIRGEKKKNAIQHETDLAERGQSKNRRTDNLPGVGLAAEDPHEVSHRDAPRPLDVKVLKRPANIVFADEDVPVDRCREELLLRRERGDMGEWGDWEWWGRERGRKAIQHRFRGGKIARERGKRRESLDCS